MRPPPSYFLRVIPHTAPPGQQGPGRFPCALRQIGRPLISGTFSVNIPSALRCNYFRNPPIGCTFLEQTLDPGCPTCYIFTHGAPPRVPTSHVFTREASPRVRHALCFHIRGATPGAPGAMFSQSGCHPGYPKNGLLRTPPEGVVQDPGKTWPS